MTRDSKKERAALERLAATFVDDILNTSDDDMLAEITEDYGKPAKVASDMRAMFEHIGQEAGKAKLETAKRAMAESRTENTSVVYINPDVARNHYERLLADGRNLSHKLTLAARKGVGQSERDIDSAIEDLAELGAFEEENDEA